MADLEIKIAGWGGVINGELEIVKRALEEYGFKVKVINEHPKIPGFKNADAILAQKENERRKTSRC